MSLNALIMLWMVTAKRLIDFVRIIPYYLMAVFGGATMYAVHEVATVTSKGQITLPKAIRDALGVDAGGKVAFDLMGSEIVISRVTETHEDPAIASFLSLLEKDIQTGQHITSLPDALAQAMLASLSNQIDLDADIDGDVAL